MPRGGLILPGYHTRSQEGPVIIEMGQTHSGGSSGDVLWSHEEIFNFKYQGAAQQPSQILVFYWPAQSCKNAKISFLALASQVLT